MINFRLFLAVAVPFSTACGVQSRDFPPSVQEGRELVERFLAAELAGDYMSEATRIYGCEEDFQPSTDKVEPVTAATILRVSILDDTVQVSVEYQILGYGHFGDQASQFTADARVDTVMFRVVKDTTDQAQIYCGPHPANHWGLATMERFVDTFDDASRSQWLGALERAPTR